MFLRKKSPVFHRGNWVWNTSRRAPLKRGAKRSEAFGGNAHTFRHLELKKVPKIRKYYA